MSARRPVVVLALTPVAEHAIEKLLFGPEAQLEPRVSVAEADELEAEAGLVGAEAVLLSPGLSGLTAAHCARVRARGVCIVGVALDEREREALAALAVDEIAVPEDALETLLTAIHADGDVSTALGASHPPAAVVPGERGNGSVIAVVGSKGAPGASECAASLAVLASERWPSLLVELDMLGGGLNVRLGADAQQGSLLGLVRAADTGEGALRELLGRWLTSRPGWPPVLLAPPDLAKALPELSRPGAVASALRALTAIYPLSVIDIGFLLGEGHECPAVARVHREALVSADSVVLVMGAREEQLRAGLTQLDALVAELALSPEKVRIVVNGVGGPGAHAKPSFDQTLALRLAERGLTADARLPWDARALARATAHGVPLAAARRRGPFAKALALLVEELFLPVAPVPRGRKHKLTPPTEAMPVEEVPLPWRI